MKEGSALIAAVQREVEQKGERSNPYTQIDIACIEIGSIPKVIKHILSTLTSYVMMFTDISNIVIFLEI